MSGAGHRIFGNAEARGKVAGDEVGLFPGRGHRRAEWMEPLKTSKVRTNGTDRRLVLINSNVDLIAFQDLRWTRPEAADKLFRRLRTRLGGVRWKVHGEQVASLGDGQYSARSRLKLYGFEFGFEQVQQHMG